ncbi:MAG: hypothetical protein V3V06_04105 [Dehalococcoidia bacterium]
MVLRRIASAIDRRSDGARRRRAILQIAASDFLSQLQQRKGSKGGTGYAGWDLSNLAQAAFWSTVLLSQRRERFAMTLLGQAYVDSAAVQPYIQEKRATQEILDATPGIDADSLIGFVDLAVHQFQPPGSSGVPLVPRSQAIEILKAALLRGAMVGELRAEVVEGAWVEAHPEARSQPARHWKTAQGRAETLYRSWRAKRKAQGRPLV